MTPQQHALLEALEYRGGAHDRYGRIVAEGETFNSTTALWCFLYGWIESDGGRIWLKPAGGAVLNRERDRLGIPRQVPMYRLDEEGEGQ